jgi:malic enzyme
MWKGDTSRHLHHRLRNAGIGKWNSIVIVSASTGILGLIGITTSTLTKLVMFIVFAGIFFVESARMMRAKKV